MIKVIENSSLNTLSNSLIKQLNNEKDFFTTTNIVFPSSEVISWFKSYFLKHHDGVLMNVNCLTFDKFFLDSLTFENGYYRLINKSTLQLLILKHFVYNEIKDYLTDVEKHYLFENGELKPNQAYALSSSFADLFLSYEKDCFVPSTGIQKHLFDLLEEDFENYRIGTLSFLLKRKKEFKVSNEKVYFFGFSNLDNFKNKVINDYSLNHDFYLFKLSLDTSFKKEFSLFSAPNKEKEIEYVHSKIASIADKENLSYNDFTILAPDLKKYESIIKKVFTQDGENYPNISSAVKCNKTNKGDTYNFIFKLYEIYLKGYYTRLDFYELISNELVSSCLNLSLDDIDVFKDTIEKLNVYNSSFSFDDFSYLKKRLILSKLSGTGIIQDDKVNLSTGEFIPFSSLSLDNDRIVKFIKIIEDLNSFLKLLNDFKGINNDFIIQFQNELNKWISQLDECGNEVNKSYIKIKKLLNNVIGFNFVDKNFSLDILFDFLLKESQDFLNKFSDIFFKGVSFIELNNEVVISSKYIFIVGLDSKSYPLINIKNELDLREYDINKDEYQKDINNLYMLYNNASNRFFVSYVNKDLSSDEEFYPSTFILELNKRLNNEIKETRIDLDETRPYKELFTKKELKDKNYFATLLRNKDIKEIKRENNNNDLNIDTQILTISLKDLKEFLKDPFKYKAVRLFGYDDADDDINEELAPFYLSNLDKKFYIKKYALEIIKGNLVINEELKAMIKADLILNNSLPFYYGEIENCVLDSLYEDVISIVKRICFDNKNKIEVIKPMDKEINIGEARVLLTEKSEYIRSTNLNNRYYFSLKIDSSYIDNVIDENVSLTSLLMDESKKSSDDKEFLNLYVQSLYDVSILNGDNKYNVYLIIDAKQKIFKTFEISPNKAKEILKDIILEALNYNNIHYFDYTKNYKNLESLRTGCEHSWAQFYKDKKMFDYFSQLGYSDDNFQEEYNEYKMKMNKLILFSFVEEKKKEDNKK